MLILYVRSYLSISVSIFLQSIHFCSIVIAFHFLSVNLKAVIFKPKKLQSTCPFTQRHTYTKQNKTKTKKRQQTHTHPKRQTLISEPTAVLAQVAKLDFWTDGSQYLSAGRKKELQERTEEGEEMKMDSLYKVSSKQRRVKNNSERAKQIKNKMGKNIQMATHLHVYQTQV